MKGLKWYKLIRQDERSLWKLAKLIHWSEVVKGAHNLQLVPLVIDSSGRMSLGILPDKQHTHPVEWIRLFGTASKAKIHHIQ